jgi:hypothetical protein
MSRWTEVKRLMGSFAAFQQDKTMTIIKTYNYRVVQRLSMESSCELNSVGSLLSIGLTLNEE